MLFLCNLIGNSNLRTEIHRTFIYHKFFVIFSTIQLYDPIVCVYLSLKWDLCQSYLILYKKLRILMIILPISTFIFQ